MNERDFIDEDYRRYVWEKENVIGECAICGEQIIRDAFKPYLLDENGKMYHATPSCMGEFFKERGEIIEAFNEICGKDETQEALLEVPNVMDILKDYAEQRGLLQG